MAFDPSVSNAHQLVEARALAEEVLRVRRRHCHAFSLMRYHAEKAVSMLAHRQGDTALACECGWHMVRSNYMQMTPTTLTGTH